MAKIEEERSYTILTGSERERAVALDEPLVRFWITYDEEPLGPFIDPSWRVAPVAMMMFEARSCPCTPECWPVGDGLPEIETYMDPLIWCLRKRGSESLIARGLFPKSTPLPEEKPLPHTYVRIPVDADVICDIFYDGNRDGLWVDTDGILYDESGEWAAYDSYDIDHLLGGTPAFMAQHYQACGGEENARAWYYHYDITYCSHLRRRGFDGRPGPVMRQTYDVAGRPYPVYPDNERGSIMPGDDIDWSTMFGDRFRSAGPRID